MVKVSKQERIELDKIEKKSMSNDDINKYLPNVQTISYNELSKYNSIEQILPTNGSYVIILYLQTPNSGHWTALMRYDDKIEYFDSYGGSIDAPLKWNSGESNEMLNIHDKYLSKLLKKSNMSVVYNNVKYQTQKQGISSCGRHCVLRIKKMLEGYDLPQYYKILSKLKNKLKLDYDEIVSGLITK